MSEDMDDFGIWPPVGPNERCVLVWIEPIDPDGSCRPSGADHARPFSGDSLIEQETDGLGSVSCCPGPCLAQKTLRVYPQGGEPPACPKCGRATRRVAGTRLPLPANAEARK